MTNKEEINLKVKIKNLENKSIEASKNLKELKRLNIKLLKLIEKNEKDIDMIIIALHNHINESTNGIQEIVEVAPIGFKIPSRLCNPTNPE